MREKTQHYVCLAIGWTGITLATWAIVRLVMNFPVATCVLVLVGVTLFVVDWLVDRMIRRVQLVAIRRKRKRKHYGNRKH